MTAFALLADVPAPPVTGPELKITFDPARQLNVLADGRPAVDDVKTVEMTTFTHNSAGFKKDDDFATLVLNLGGPTMTHNSDGLKKDDD